MSKADFDVVAAAALSNVDALLAEWLPGGRYDGHEYVALNPTRADKRLGSFRINTHTGVWSDFATDDSGSDLIALYAYLYTNNHQGSAFRAVAERLRIGNFAAVEKKPFDGGGSSSGKERDSWTPIYPIDEDKLNILAGSSAFRFRANGKTADRRAVYRDADGRPLFVVQRFIREDGSKEDLPFAWCKNSAGVMEWRNRRIDNPQPLYGLDVLAKNLNAHVLVVEGEKCKDAADGYFVRLRQGNESGLSEYVAVSWLGGCNGWKKADWQPLAGRDVVLWPDCDSQREKRGKAGAGEAEMMYLPKNRQPGMAAMLGIAEMLHGMGCRVRFVDIPSPGEWRDGYDIADMIDDEEPPATVREMLSRLSDYCPNDVPAVESFADTSKRERVRADTRGGDGDNGAAAKVLADMLEEYAQIGGKERVISLKTGETFSRKQFEKLYTKFAVNRWFGDVRHKRLSEIEAEIASKKLKLEALATYDGFKDVLDRYIYLDGTTDAFDIKLDKIVSLAAVKASIPDTFDDWQKSPKRLCCPIDNYVFNPDLATGISYSDDGNVLYINQFKGLLVDKPDFVTPIDGDLPMERIVSLFPGCKNIISLIQNLCSGNGEKSAAVFEWVINWIACRFLMPAKKPATSLIFISEVQGVGKTTFGNVLHKIFGNYYRSLDQNALESRFNAALQFALITIFEEISPSDERMNVIGKFKNMITTETAMIERKGRDAQQFDDFNSYIVFSNDDRSIPIESNDRRFMVSFCRTKFTEDQFLALKAEIDNGGLEEFAAFLSSLPLMYTNDSGERVKFTPHSRPIQTMIKRRMINMNKSGWEAFIDDWHSGDLGLPFISCQARDLWAVYKFWCNETKTFVMTQKNFYANISKRFHDVRTNVSISGISKKVRLFVIPHAAMSAENQRRYPMPNTDDVARDSRGAITKMQYYGKMVDDFNVEAQKKCTYLERV